jgi:hypothetical protein
MHEQITFGTLLTITGRAFVEYACNLSPEELQGRVEETTPLSPVKEAALQTLIDCASRVYSPTSTTDDRRFALVGFLTDYSHRFTDTVTLNQIRESAGGTFYETRRRDPVAKKLAELARYSYPFYLIPAEPNQPRSESSVPSSQLSYYSRAVSHTHTTNTELVELLPADTTLSQLFPEQSGETETSRAYVIHGFNTGSGSVAQASLFAYGIIQQTFAKLAATKVTFTCQEFVDECLSNLELLKSLIHGEQKDVPLITAVSGLKLEEGQSITTEWGILRKARDIEKIWLKPPFQNQSYEIDVVFESKFGMKMIIADNLGEIPFPQSDNQSDKETEEKLAIISALPQIALNKTIRIMPLTSKLIPPFQTGDSMSYPWVNPYPFSDVLTNEEISSVEELAIKVANADYKRIIISFRRLASAVRRTDITDGFIDLVVIWENLFGTKSGEVKFRIALSMSKLLGETESERQRIFTQVSDLYKHRSNIVHGSSHYSWREVGNFWEQSLELTIKVLSKLFNERPELLTFNSDTRSKKLGLN